MSKFANFVQCSLAAAITVGATSVEVEAEAPYSLPPDPAGEVAYITLMDSLNGPTAVEIISYTGRTTIDATTVELTGVTRGAQGTTARAWPAATFARQDITEAQLDLLELPSIGLWAGSNDNQVARFTVNGELMWTSGVHVYPIVFMDVDADGNSYSVSFSVASVGATGDIFIKKIDSSGSLVWEITESSDVTYKGGLRYGRDGHLYLATGTEVVKYDLDGNEVWRYAHGLTGGTRDFDVDRDGNVFLTNDGGDMIRIYPDGSLAWTVTLTGTAPGIAVGVSSGFHVWIATVDEIYRYDYNGDTIGSPYAEPSVPSEFNALDDGSVIVSRGGEGWLKLDKDAAEVWDQGFAAPNPNGGSGRAVVDANGDVYGGSGTGETIKVDGGDGSVIWRSDLFPLDPTNTYAAYAAGLGDPIFQDGFEKTVRAVRWDDLANKPQTVDQLVFEETPEPQTPPSGKAIMFLDSADGDLKIKFDDGTVTTIAP